MPRMPIDVTPILLDYLASNSGPVPEDPERRSSPAYGVRAALAGDMVDVELIFLSGSAYCCCEWGCHLGLFNGKRWDRLRQRLSARRVIATAQMQLRLTVTVEDGAT